MNLRSQLCCTRLEPNLGDKSTPSPPFSSLRLAQCNNGGGPFLLLERLPPGAPPFVSRTLKPTMASSRRPGKIWNFIIIFSYFLDYSELKLLINLNPLQYF